MTPLTNIIINKIAKEGVTSFHDFMEMALYYPVTGYYTSENQKIGMNGDFYTSSHLHNIFGVLVAKQLEEMWNLLNQQSFTIVEYGAGNGFLCHDILNYLSSNSNLYNNLRYCIIEKSPAMRAREKQHLCENKKVSWHNSIADIGKFCGCVLSNELLDNFSVHQVYMNNSLKEIFVDYDEKGFKEFAKPANETLINYFEELNVCLPPDFKTEVNLEAIDWIKSIATHLEKGFVLTIDYGYPSNELYASYRSEGTIVCYYKHHVNFDPYKNIGMQDITSHVNFSALYYWGLKNGLEGCGFTDQAHFLTSLGFNDYLKQTATPGNDVQNFRKELLLTQKLIVDMGSKFKVMIQHKGMNNKPLSGLRIKPNY